MNNQSDKALNKTLDLRSLSVFKNESNLDFFYKKSDRLCTAVFLLTEPFLNNDVLKDSLRKSAILLLDLSLSLTSIKKDKASVFNEMTKYSLQILSLSKIASDLKMIAESNLEVLEGEIYKFISSIEENITVDNSGLVKSLFDNSFASSLASSHSVPVAPVNPVITINPNVLNDIENIEDNSNNQGDDTFSEVIIDNSIEVTNIKSDGVSKDSEKRVFGFVKKTDSVKKFNEYLGIGSSDANVKEEGTISNTSSNNNSTMQKSDRQKMILDIIRKLGESSIKDISDGVSGCSEKTIQRELNNLIYDGVLKKVGERRWSKYILA